MEGLPTCGGLRNKLDDGELFLLGVGIHLGCESKPWKWQT